MQERAPQTVAEIIQIGLSARFGDRYGSTVIHPAEVACAERTRADLERLAASMAAQFSKICPRATTDDAEAHNKCAAGLRDIRSPEGSSVRR
jgi:hypothetical protein